MNGGKLSSKQITLVTVSVAVVFIAVLGAIYFYRYEGVFFLIVLLVVKSAFLLLTEDSLSSDHLGKSKEGSLDIKRDLVACGNGLLYL